MRERERRTNETGSLSTRCSEGIGDLSAIHSSILQARTAFLDRSFGMDASVAMMATFPRGRTRFGGRRTSKVRCFSTVVQSFQARIGDVFVRGDAAVRRVVAFQSYVVRRDSQLADRTILPSPSNPGRPQSCEVGNKVYIDVPVLHAASVPQIAPLPAQIPMGEQNNA